MTLILEIPEELEVSLTAKAEDLGLPLPELALNLLGARGGPMSAEEVKTGADLVRYWREHGVIGTLPPDTDPVALSRSIRERAQTRNRD